jgi:hypothetical protein
MITNCLMMGLEPSTKTSCISKPQKIGNVQYNISTIYVMYQMMITFVAENFC